MTGSKSVLREFAALRDAVQEVKARFAAGAAEWSARAERAEDARSRAEAELEAATLSYGKQVDQWELLKTSEAASRAWQVPPETAYLANKLRDAYERHMVLVDEALKAKNQLLSQRSKLRNEEDIARLLRSKWEELREELARAGQGHLVGSLHTVLSSTDVREQPLSVITLGSLDAALCRCEEALAQDSDAYQPEEEQEADGSTSRCARELREAQLRVRKLEAEVQELRERDAQRQAAERDRVALRNRVELLESKLEGICAVAEPEALPTAFDALASVDKKEREVEKLEVARMSTELEELRKGRWASVASSLTNLPSMPAEEWGALAELLEQFTAALSSEDPSFLGSRARELSCFCALAASALRGRPVAAASTDMVAALRLDLAHARRGWSEVRAKLVAKPPRPAPLTLAHMECCLRVEELEQRLRFDVNSSSRARATARDGEDTAEQLEDVSARCARLEIELDNLNVDYQNKIDSLNEAQASIEQYKISNRNFLREAAECRAQLTVSQDSQQKEMDLYLNRITSLSQELDSANRKLREFSRGGDPLTSTTASVSGTGASLSEKIATDAAREEAERLRTERGLIDAHLARIADAMGVTAVGTVERAAELSELLLRA
jgi:hypothetical protein